MKSILCLVLLSVLVWAKSAQACSPSDQTCGWFPVLTGPSTVSVGAPVTLTVSEMLPSSIVFLRFVNSKGTSFDKGNRVTDGQGKAVFVVLGFSSSDVGTWTAIIETATFKSDSIQFKVQAANAVPASSTYSLIGLGLLLILVVVAKKRSA